MEPRRCDQIVPERVALEPQDAQEASPQPGRAGRHVAGARVGAPDMGAERAALAMRVVGVGKLVPGDLIEAGADPIDPVVAERRQRLALARAADHGGAQALALVGIRARLPVEKLPKAPYVLMQLPEHEVAAVAPQVAPVRHLLGRRQVDGARIAHRVDQRPRGVQPVLVGIAEHELAERQQIAVRDVLLVACKRTLPVDGRLAHAVGEAERLVHADVESRQVGQHAKRLVPLRALDLPLPALEPLRPGIRHDQEMRHPPGSAPGPAGRRIGADVAQPARAVRLARHARQKLVGEAQGHLVRNPQRLEARAAEGHLQRGRRRRIGFLGAGHGCCLQPAASGVAVGDLEEEERRLGQLAVTEPHQALQVAVVDLGRPWRHRRFHAFQRRRVACRGPTAHKRRSHSLASLSVIAGRSMPWRIRLLRSRSTTVRPGYALYQTSVGS